MSTFVYEVRGRTDIFVGKETFAMKVIKHEAKDTGKSLMFDRKRFDKSKLGVVTNADQHDSSKAIGFHTFVLEEGLEEAKNNVIEAIRNHAELRLKELTQLVQLTKKEPVETFRDETIE